MKTNKRGSFICTDEGKASRNTGKIFFFKQGTEVGMHKTRREKTQERGDKGCLWGRDLGGGIRSGKGTCFSHLPF